MATPQLLPNIASGNTGATNQIMSTLGQQPIGNAGGSNTPGPTGINAIMQPALGLPGTVPPTGAVPTAGAPVTGAPGTNSLLPASGTPGQAIPVQQQSNSSQQLNTVFGKGIGGDINSVINNLGSNDSTYMQAYSAAMAPQNAQQLATLNTTLGNSGVSANSSTAAIADATFESGVTSQEGLQEQQLQQTDEQNLIGLLTSTEGAANKEASTSDLSIFGDVLGAVGADAGAALGGTDLKKLF